MRACVHGARVAWHSSSFAIAPTTITQRWWHPSSSARTSSPHAPTRSTGSTSAGEPRASDRPSAAAPTVGRSCARRWDAERSCAGRQISTSGHQHHTIVGMWGTSRDLRMRSRVWAQRPIIIPTVAPVARGGWPHATHLEHVRDDYDGDAVRRRGERDAESARRRDDGPVTRDAHGANDDLAHAAGTRVRARGCEPASSPALRLAVALGRRVAHNDTA